MTLCDSPRMLLNKSLGPASVLKEGTCDRRTNDKILEGGFYTVSAHPVESVC